MDREALRLLQDMLVPYGYRALKRLRKVPPRYVARMYVETCKGPYVIGGRRL